MTIAELPAEVYWSDKLARLIKPADIMGNMSLRAKVWRALVDLGWAHVLNVSYRERVVWVWRRLTQ